MGSNYSRELEVAIEAVRHAARLCTAVQSKITPDVLEKKDKSPVTVADFGSQALICRALGTAFPNDPIIGEEDAKELRDPAGAEFLQRVSEELAATGLEASNKDICDWIDRGGTQEFHSRFWTLDPIDGTKGFLRGEQYAISLALIVDGRIDIGVLGCPNLPVSPGQDASGGSIFFAVRGAGASVMMLGTDGSPTPISVSQTEDSSLAAFCESVESGHSAHDKSTQVAETLKISKPAVRLDSQAKYAVVARGEADIYLRLPTRADYQERIWDHAGGVMIVEEAGGKVTDVAGKPLEFNHGRTLAANRGVVVTNGRLHDRVIAAVKQAGVT